MTTLALPDCFSFIVRKIRTHVSTRRGGTSRLPFVDIAAVSQLSPIRIGRFGQIDTLRNLGRPTNAFEQRMLASIFSFCRVSRRVSAPIATGRWGTFPKYELARRHI